MKVTDLTTLADPAVYEDPAVDVEAWKRPTRGLLAAVAPDSCV